MSSFYLECFALKLTLLYIDFVAPWTSFFPKILDAKNKFLNVDLFSIFNPKNYLRKVHWCASYISFYGRFFGFVLKFDCTKNKYVYSDIECSCLYLNLNNPVCNLFLLDVYTDNQIMWYLIVNEKFLNSYVLLKNWYII